MSESDEPENPPTKKRSVSKDASVLVVGNVLATIADILAPLLIFRLTGKDEVASLSALLLTYNTLALLLLAGFHQSITYFLPGRSLAERAAVARKVVRLLMVLGAVCGGLLFVVGKFGTSVIEAVGTFEGDATDLSPLMFLVLFPVGDLPARILPNLAVVEGRPKVAAGYGVFRSLCISVATVLPLALGFEPSAVAMCLSVVAFAQLGFVNVVLGRCYAAAERIASPVSTKEMVKFGVPLGATDMVASLNNRFDQLLILTNFPDAIFAAYRAGSYQIPVITRVPYLVTTALAPSMVEAFREGRARDALNDWRHAIGKVSLIVVPSTLVFFVGAEPMVRIVATDAYLEAVPVFRWYTLLSMMRVAAFGTVIVAAGHPKYVLHAAVVSFGFNVLLSVPLMLGLGFIGPAMGTTLAFIPIVAFYISKIAKATGIPYRDIFPLGRYLRVVAVASVGAAIAWIVADAVDVPAIVELLLIAVIVLGCFAGLATATKTMVAEDWAFITAKLRRRKA
ncbi:MAG: oligosaccharide flippase family protein [Myxococcota bacterium]